MLDQKNLVLAIIIMVVLLALGMGGWALYIGWQTETAETAIRFYANPNTGECLMEPQKNINEELIGKGFDEFVGNDLMSCKIWKCGNEGGVWNQDTLSCSCPDQNESFKHNIGCVTEGEEVNYKSLCERTDGKWLQGGEALLGEVQGEQVWLPLVSCKCSGAINVWDNVNGCQKRE